MRTISLRATGLDALRRHIRGLPGAAAEAVAPGFQALAEDVAGEVRDAFGTAAGPSAPGTAPDDPSGRLAASVAAEPSETGSVVTVAAPEARFLEYGTIRMAARPFLRPAALRAGPRAVTRLVVALRQGLGA